MAMENPDEFIDPWVHYRFTYGQKETEDQQAIHSESI